MWWFRLRRMIRTFGRDALVLLAACRDPATPAWVRVATLALVAYALSPVDLVPDLLGPLAWLDDATLLALGIPFLLRRLPPRGREAAARRVATWLDRMRLRRARAG